MNEDKQSQLLVPTRWRRSSVLGGIYIPGHINVVYEKPTENVIAYINYSRLFPGKPNSLDKIKKEFSKYFVRDIMQWLCKINYFIARKYRGANLEDYWLAKELLKQVREDELERWKGEIKFFSRQQMLANMKMALLHSQDNMKAKMVHENMEVVSEMIFRVTDFLESGEEQAHDPDKVRALMARNLLFNESYSLNRGLARYSYIFHRLKRPRNSKEKTLNALFWEATGVSFAFYQSVGFAIWGFYDERNFKERLSEPKEFIISSHYFRKTNRYTRFNHKKVVRLLSSTFNELKDKLKEEEKELGEFYSFQAFFRAPLIRDGDNFYLLDNLYLERRITEGAFWHILDKAEDKRVTRSYWGKIFEQYVLDLCESVYGKTGRVLSEIKGDETYGVDIVIHYPGTLVLLEITTRRIAYNDWISADPKKIEERIKEILIKADRRSKASQLSELQENILNKKVALRGIDLSTIKRVVPIVIFEQSLPCHPGLWPLYAKPLESEGFNKKFVDELMFWDIEDLELVLGQVEHGITFTQAVEEMERDNYKHNSVKNFYVLRKKDIKSPKFCKDNFDSFAKRNAKTLFSRKI